jgi:hypothetical protein
VPAFLMRCRKTRNFKIWRFSRTLNVCFHCEQWSCGIRSSRRVCDDQITCAALKHFCYDLVTQTAY